MSILLDELEEKERLFREERQAATSQLIAEMEAKENASSRQEQGLQQLGNEFGEMAANYPSSLGGYFKDIGEGVHKVVTDPIGVAQEAITLGEAAFERGGRKFEEFYTGEEIPATKPEVEAPLDEIADYYRENYGTVDLARQSFIDDPVGSTADVFPFLGQRFGPTAMANKGGQAVAGNVSDRLYRRAAGIQPSRGQEGLDLARASARERIDVTEGGQKIVERMKTKLGEDIDALLAQNMMAGNGYIDKRVLNRHMDELIQSRRGTYSGDTEVPFLQKEKVRLMNLFGDRDELALFELQKYKKDTYQQAYEAAAAGPMPDKPDIAAQTSAQRVSARGAKEALEEQVKGYGPLNRQYETYAKILPYIKKRIDQIPDDFLGAMYKKTLDNPKFQSKLGVALRRYADGDMGWLEKNLNSPEIRTVMYLVGEHGQPPDEQRIPTWGGKQ